MTSEYRRLEKELERSVKNMHFYLSRNLEYKHYLELYAKSVRLIKRKCEDVVTETINEETESYE